MLKFYITGMLCGGLLAAHTANSQDWVQKLQEPTTNFYEVQRAFNEHWQNRPYERGKGFKQFKRIEYMMEPRVYPSGDRAHGTPSKARGYRQ